MEALLVEQVSLHVPATLDACALIREKINEVATKLPFSDTELGDIRLAVGEAASNAVRHGCKGCSFSEVVVRCWTSDTDITIQVEDYGEGFDPETVCEPDFVVGLPEGGMGIYYMRCVMDTVKFDFQHGTRVTLVKKFTRSL